ncbi:hypothetical protein SERLA73DRAFT_109126 [Serpula lacrymans var. lacrymans S7.3]|uniref:SWI/SNF and RSC complexes subunit Ssr4 N-terminal domain-containing protein n=1 Tax=Serpula lacrymans var. lacrymans (strain S7.3) TaxID=936435 RepID=F8Q0P2_SERL3|nr:hypothetical protein SERLA73DRAFT_109126 [Serpula lacrymans var. lacrymans S7.3]
MSFQQMPPDTPCLRYPETPGLHQTVTYEAAINMLLRAIQLSQNVPYTWNYIDKPQDGQVVLIFLNNLAAFPNDGIRYQDQETRYTIPAGSTRELEVMEIKYGFVPNSQDTSAWRLRRRYRLHKGGHPQIVLVHYTRGPPIQIIPSLLNQPVRQYPLRQISDPPVYVMGEKAGQKVYPGPGGGQIQGLPSGAPSGPMPPIGMGMGGMNINTQAMLAQQNMNMEALERRRERERGRERSSSMGGRPPPPRVDEDDSADESEFISTRTLALTRFRRNHELMEEVFKQAAFGNKKSSPPPSPYSIFDKSELDTKAVRAYS